MKIIALFPGRFQPCHLGHKSVYDFLVGKYGHENVYITTTDVTDSIKSPFNFSDKVVMLTSLGIPKNKIIQVKNNYNIESVKDKISGFNVETDGIVLAISLKDMTEDPRFKGFKKKDGSPTYLQPLPPNGEIQPAVKHGYLITAPTINFSIMRTPINSATQLRRMYVNADEETRRKIIVDMYGSFNDNIFKIMNSKLNPQFEDKSAQLKESLKKYITKLMTEDSSKIKLATVKTKDALIRQRSEEKKDKDDKLKVIKTTVPITSKQSSEQKMRNKEELLKANDGVKSAKSNLDAAKKEKLAAQKMN